MTLMDDVTVQYKGLNSVTYSILFYKAFSTDRFPSDNLFILCKNKNVNMVKNKI